MKNMKSNVWSFATAKLQAKINISLLIMIFAVIGFSMAACGGGDDDSGGGGGGGSGGGLTFSDGLPSGNFTVFIMPNSTGTDIISISMALSSYTAFGGASVVSGNSVPLFTSGYARWTDSGSYMVVVNIPDQGSTSEVYKYIKDVSFSGGNATITKSSLTQLLYN